MSLSFPSGCCYCQRTVWRAPLRGAPSFLSGQRAARAALRTFRASFDFLLGLRLPRLGEVAASFLVDHVLALVALALALALVSLEVSTALALRERAAFALATILDATVRDLPPVGQVIEVEAIWHRSSLSCRVEAYASMNVATSSRSQRATMRSLLMTGGGSVPRSTRAHTACLFRKPSRSISSKASMSRRDASSLNCSGARTATGIASLLAVDDVAVILAAT